MRARAAVLRAARGPLELTDVQLGSLRADEVLVEIAGVGICHTDLVARDGILPVPLPTVLGHEGAGRVIAVGEDVDALAPGAEVVLTYDHCRTCAPCAAGTPGYCTSFAPRNYSGHRLDGTTTLRDGAGPVHGSWLAQSSWATHAIATVRNAVPVQTEIELALLGPLGCSLLTGAGAVLRALRPGPGDGIGIIGLGSVGLAAVMAAVAAGCAPIIAVDRRADRVELALELGASDGVAADAVDDVVRHIRRLSGGGVPYSVEAVGAGPVVRQALEVLSSPGRCATTGFRGAHNEITVDQGQPLFGRHLLGVIEGDADPHQLIGELLGLHAAGRFPFERLITTFPLDAIDDAIRAMHRGDVVKPVLVP